MIVGLQAIALDTTLQEIRQVIHHGSSDSALRCRGIEWLARATSGMLLTDELLHGLGRRRVVSTGFFIVGPHNLAPKSAAAGGNQFKQKHTRYKLKGG